MIRRLIILLLIVGCEELIESVITESVIEGCTDANADNYNTEANEDDGSCVYTTMYVNINPNLTPSEITTAIQIAIDSATQVNKRLIFEKATYITNAVITIPSNADIDFGESTIKRESGTGEGDIFDMIVNLDSDLGNENITLQNLIIDGNATGLSPHILLNRFSGLKLSKVSESTLKNITVINTVNGEHRDGDQTETPASGIFFTNGCENIHCSILNAFFNDVTGITIYKSTYITIDSSVTSNNGGSGIGSKDSDYCNFYRIHSYNNGNTSFPSAGSEPHFSNISINGESCVVNQVKTYNCTGSGLNIGHNNEESKADYTIVDDVESYHNELEGITIRNSDHIDLSNIKLHHNKRNNLLIKSGLKNNEYFDATYVTITNSIINGYYNQNGDSGDPQYDGGNPKGGYGVRIEEGWGHSIDSTEIYDNYYNGIGIIDVTDTVTVGSGVKIYNNGRADELGNPNHKSSGIRIDKSYNCRIKCPEIYCTEPDSVKSQDYGIHILDGGNHIIEAKFPVDSPNAEHKIYCYWGHINTELGLSPV